MLLAIDEAHEYSCSTKGYWQMAIHFSSYHVELRYASKESTLIFENTQGATIVLLGTCQLEIRTRYPVPLLTATLWSIELYRFG